MQHILSTHLFVSHRLTTVWLERVWDAGIPAIEIYCAKQHLDYRNKAQIGELGYWFRDAQLKVHSLHAPIYTDEVWGRSGPQAVVNIAQREKAKRIDSVDEIKRALEIAETVPFRYLIQHLGATGEEFDEFKVEAAFSSLEELALFAKHRDVEILLENTPSGMASAERLLTFLELTHLNLNFCFDTGHAHMNEGVENAYRLMKPRIRSTHVHDNNGTDDQHLFPIENPSGTIDWSKTMDLLRSAPGQYPLLLELREPEGMANSIDVAKSVFERLEQLESRNDRR